MFAKTIIDSDAFLDMPLTAQALYFHLSMRADDEGFLNNAKKIMRTIGANQNDYDLLVVKRFIIQFEDGICVIKHWRIHNWIRNDRKKETIYKQERAMLGVKDNGAYTLESTMSDTCQSDGSQMVVQMDTQYRLGKDRLGKVSIKEYVEDESPTTVPAKSQKDSKHKYGEYKHVLLKESEFEKLKKEFGASETQAAIQCLDEYIEMKGTKYKSHYLAMRKWVFEAVKEKAKRGATQSPKQQQVNNKFNNFQQRQYSKEEFAEMERNLLGVGR